MDSGFSPHTEKVILFLREGRRFYLLYQLKVRRFELLNQKTFLGKEKLEIRKIMLENKGVL